MAAQSLGRTNKKHESLGLQVGNRGTYAGLHSLAEGIEPVFEIDHLALVLVQVESEEDDGKRKHLQWRRREAART